MPRSEEGNSMTYGSTDAGAQRDLKQSTVQIEDLSDRTKAYQLQYILLGV